MRRFIHVVPMQKKVGLFREAANVHTQRTRVTRNGMGANWHMRGESPYVLYRAKGED